MPSETPTQPLSDAKQTDLAQLLARAVTDVPGVVRLEPTLQNAMIMLVGKAVGTARLGQPGPASLGDAVLGVRVSLLGISANVRVDLAVDTSRSAASTATAVEQTLVNTLHEHGYLPGTLLVTILAIDAQADHPHS